jgi:hypothetical protein
MFAYQGRQLLPIDDRNARAAYAAMCGLAVLVTTLSDATSPRFADAEGLRDFLRGLALVVGLKDSISEVLRIWRGHP